MSALQEAVSEALRRKSRDESRCPDCVDAHGDRYSDLDYLCAFGGDEEGRNMTTLYQCPNCKKVVVQ